MLRLNNKLPHCFRDAGRKALVRVAVEKLEAGPDHDGQQAVARAGADRVFEKMESRLRL